MNAAIQTPAWCADAWVMHQLYRKLGFTPDEIYFDCLDTIDRGPQCVLVSVKREEKTFMFNIGHVETPPEATYEIWSNFALHMNQAPDAELQAIWEASEVQQKLPRMELILRLVDKGFMLTGLSAKDVELLRKAREAPRGVQS